MRQRWPTLLDLHRSAPRPAPLSPDPQARVSPPPVRSTMRLQPHRPHSIRYRDMGMYWDVLAQDWLEM